MREYLTLECVDCGGRNYRTQRETKTGGKLDLKKFCKVCRAHTRHKERKK